MRRVMENQELHKLWHRFATRVEKRLEEFDGDNWGIPMTHEGVLGDLCALMFFSELQSHYVDAHPSRGHCRRMRPTIVALLLRPEKKAKKKHPSGIGNSTLGMERRVGVGGPIAKGPRVSRQVAMEKCGWKTDTSDAAASANEMFLFSGVHSGLPKATEALVCSLMFLLVPHSLVVVVHVTVLSSTRMREEMCKIPEQNPPTSGIVRLDSHVRKSEATPLGIKPVLPGREARNLTPTPLYPTRSRGVAVGGVAANSAPRVRAVSSVPRIQAASSTPRIQAASREPKVQAACSVPRVQATSSTPRIQAASSTAKVQVASSAAKIQAANSTPSVQAASSTARGPGSEQHAQDPGSEQRAQSPGSVQRAQGPGNEQHAQGPGSEKRDQDPGSEQRAQVPGNEQHAQDPGSEQHAQDPGSEQRAQDPGSEKRDQDPGSEQHAQCPGSKQHGQGSRQRRPRCETRLVPSTFYNLRWTVPRPDHERKTSILIFWGRGSASDKARVPTIVIRVPFPEGVAPGFSHSGNCAGPVVGGFSRRSPVFPRPYIPALLHTHLALPSSALKTSITRASELSTNNYLLGPQEWDGHPSEPRVRGQKSEGAIRAKLIRPPSASSLLRARRAEFPSGNRAERCRWSVGFLWDISFPPPLHSDAAPYLLQSPSSALRITLLRATQISSLTHIHDTEKILLQVTRSHSCGGKCQHTSKQFTRRQWTARGLWSGGKSSGKQGRMCETSDMLRGVTNVEKRKRNRETGKERARRST
ncbi:hypothetical protein PR048_009574 [Dryococelus australis]|uniref:Uncharacterized protein n=1 Tax=Dryococelus australis TaxID=614101 RepID=A0ABQ9I0A8_9NEOP|nr:hypothetical protein PR048_009574 [Dryococelus australis]